MPLTKIGKMSLKNQGGFTTRIMFSYLDGEGEKKLSGQSGDIRGGTTQTTDPGDLGVPNGSVVSIHAFVLWGKDNEAKDSFLYEKGNPTTAEYSISGTTGKNELALIEVVAWTNWAGSISTIADSLLRPTSVSDLKNIIAGHPEGTIRAVGTGHSWSPLVATSDILVDAKGITENGRKAWRWQKDAMNLVTYLPSARWADVRDVLTDASSPLPLMYLPTAGVLPSINATGFVAAGCHGTGWLQPTVSDLIYAIEIVASDGQVHVFSEDTTPNEMNAVRVNLGALGIISKVTLKVDPMYRLWDQELIVSTAEVMGPNPVSNGGKVDASKLSARVTANDYVELFWFPWSGWELSGTLDDGSVWVKQFKRTEEEPRNVPPRPPDWQIWLAEFAMELVAEHSPLTTTIELGVWQQLTAQIQSIQQTNGFIADAPRVLHYQEDAFSVIDLEIAIPIPSTGTNSWDFTNVVTAWYQAVNYVRDKYQNSVYPLTCCLHARFIKNSQALLSPAYEAAGSNIHYCWIEVLSAYPKAETDPNTREKYIAAYQDLVNTVGPTWIKQLNGRPHWAKYWQNIPGINIKALFPQANLDRFNSLRRQLDPKGMFLNAFLKGLNLFE